MSKTVKQIYDTNPVTTVDDADLMYLVQSPYGADDNAAISGLSLNALYAQRTQVQANAFNFALSTGVNDAFVVTLNPAPSALTDGMLVIMYSGTLQNLTDTPTLNVNGLGAKPIVTFTGTIAPEDIETGSNYLFVYNSVNDNFQLLNPFITTADTFLVQQNGYSYALDSGIADAYIANILPNNDSLIMAGMPIVMRAINTNTAASTLTVNGITKSIENNVGAALSAGEIQDNQMYYFIYNDSSDKFTLINSSSAVNSIVGTANQVLVNGGSGSPVTGSGIVLTTPQDIAMSSSPEFVDLVLSGGVIYDEDNQAMVSFSTRSNSINSLNISNSTSGGAVSLAIVTAGIDEDVPLSLSSLGNAGLRFATEAVTQPPWSLISGSLGQHTTNFLFSNTAQERNVTFPDADGTVAFNSGILTFVPTITFQTPGNLSVAYATQTASYSKIGNLVTVQLQITFTPTFTTSAGALLINTMPFTIDNASIATGGVGLSGITFVAGITYACLIAQGSSFGTSLFIQSYGSGKPPTSMGVLEFASGAQYSIFGSISYLSS